MTSPSLLLDNTWQKGSGPLLQSVNPATGTIDWSGPSADPSDISLALQSGQRAQPAWEATTLEHRKRLLRTFAELTATHRSSLAQAISADTAKPRWEAETEVNSVVGKSELAIAAYHDRTPTRDISPTAHLTHRAIGVIAVLGPFNFPAHLPNGHILPALLAGNTVVYKPSEHAPLTARAYANLLIEAGLPPGVLNVAIGGADAGSALVKANIDGVAFTGSSHTGKALHRALAGRPHVVLALEMGGNNPLVVGDTDDTEAAVNIIVRSAFITAGQRCTCARRLYVADTDDGAELTARLVDTVDRLIVGGPDTEPEPFMGPVISEAAANNVRARINALVEQGAKVLTGPGNIRPGTGFVEPTIVDTTGLALDDDEIFGPVLCLNRYTNIDQAFTSAADTKYGLAATLITTQTDLFKTFCDRIKAGVVNLNAPTTGASGQLPFGGTGISGNHRPAGWYSADYCAYPVASIANAAASATELIGLAQPTKRPS